MPNANPIRIPVYAKHKASNQAVVYLDGKERYLGKYGTARSKQEYRRLIGELLARQGRPERPPETLTINELLLAYWNYSKEYHGWSKRDGYCLKDVMRIVKEVYGRSLAGDFGPLALKVCRQRMIEKDWCRTYVNAQTARITRMFKWAAAEQMLPASVHAQLATVEGLHKGKTQARESERIRPVSLDHVDAALLHMPPTVRAMVKFQLITGCRPAEACIVRPIDIDMKNPACWVYRPARHKCEHHDQERLILIGPKGQDVLRAFLGVKVDGYCFSPQQSEEARSIKRRQERKTPLTPSQGKCRRKRNRRRAPRDHYDTISYRNAIWRACAKADRVAHEQNPGIAADQPIIPRWSPNRLRHSRATELRCHGVDMVATILGHNKVETSQVYSEKNIAAAMAIVSQVG
jgi:integrase